MELMNVQTNVEKIINIYVSQLEGKGGYWYLKFEPQIFNILID